MAKTATDAPLPPPPVFPPEPDSQDDIKARIPLSAAERAWIHSVVASASPRMAARVASELDGDPIARSVASLEMTIQAEMRQIRTQVLTGVLIVVLAGMFINAAMVGIGISYGMGQQQITVTPPTPIGSVKVPTFLPSPVPVPDVRLPVYLEEDAGNEPIPADSDAIGGEDTDTTMPIGFDLGNGGPRETID